MTDGVGAVDPECIMGRRAQQDMLQVCAPVIVHNVLQDSLIMQCRTVAWQGVSQIRFTRAQHFRTCAAKRRYGQIGQDWQDGVVGTWTRRTATYIVTHDHVRYASTSTRQCQGCLYVLQLRGGAHFVCMQLNAT